MGLWREPSLGRLGGPPGILPDADGDRDGLRFGAGFFCCFERGFC